MKTKNFLLIVAVLVSAASVSASAASVKLQWSQPTQTGVIITAYNIYRSTTSGAEAPPGVGSVQMAGTTPATTWTDTTVVPGKTYFYKVTAWCNACTGTKESAMSNEVMAAIPSQIIIVQPPVQQPAQVILP